MITVQTKKGFSFIEIIIGLAVSSILMSFLFTIYSHIGKSGAKIEKTTKMDSEIIIFRDRFQKDLNGIVPLCFTNQIYKKIKSSSIKPDQQEREQHDPDEFHGAYFFSENQEDSERLNLLTFITNSYLKSFDQINKAPQRVIYSLKKDRSNQKYFTFLRKEIDVSSPDFKKTVVENSGKFYEILNNILDFSIEYQFIDQKDEKKNEEIVDSSQPPKYKSLNDWGVVTKKTEATGHKPPLPEFIKIKLKIEEQGKINEYELIFELLINVNDKKTSFAQKREKIKRDKKKGNTLNPETVEGN